MSNTRGAFLRAAVLVCLCLAAQGCGRGERPAERPGVEARLARTLEGHAEVVWQVAFSPDGARLASGSREKGTLGTAWKQFAPASLAGSKGQTVRLWQTADGTLQQVLAEHDADVHSVAFSPDSRLLASSGYDNAVKLYTLEAR